MLLADPAPLENGSQARADDALLGLNLAGPAGRPVVFDEYDHGYGQSGSGIAGLPIEWKVGLALALAAVLVWIVSAFRRFGPPEADDRHLPPPRRAYVDAMGSLLVSVEPTARAEAAQPLRDEGRRRLCRRLGLDSEAPDAAILHAAHLAGVPEAVVTAVITPSGNGKELVAMGRTVASLEARGGGAGQ